MKKTIIFFASAVVSIIPGFAQLSLNSSPSRIVGQTRLTLTSAEPNLVEGREVQAPQGITVDMSSGGPGPLYVADTLNNRVLAWKNSSAFANGAKADVVIGQADFFSTLSKTSGGLTAPTGLAVDNQGNLYVADSANNRILRYPKPFNQAGETKLPDMVIGQTSFSGTGTNAGGAVSASSIATNVNGSVFSAGLVFDQSGNLWFSDAINNRILRYPAANLAAGANGPAADIVLGQSTFTTNTLASFPAGVDPRTSKDVVYEPAGLTFDQAGRLYVCDKLGRVVVFAAGAQTGQKSARIMGVIPRTTSQPPTITPTNVTLGLFNSAGTDIAPPDAVFAIGNAIYVADTPNHRIMRFDPFDQWPQETASFSPAANAVYGQENFINNKGNRGALEPASNTLNSPTAAFAAGNNVFVADSGNNRVLVFRNANVDSAVAVLGQDDFPYNSPNLIEGREFNFFAGFARVNGVNAILAEGIGMAVDVKSNTPALWVADPYNHRVLGFRDVRKVRPGDRADIVIGQGYSKQFSRAFVNYPYNDANLRNDSGLNTPVAVAVDPFGDIWVVDAGNSRVLRFPQPWANEGGNQRANLVIGQPNFNTQLPLDPTVNNLAHPAGIVFTSAGHLLVSDVQHNRVLFYQRPSGGDFVNGQPASKVFGQQDFNSATAVVNNPLSGMAFPHGIAIDVDDRLYVADTGNNRVQIFDVVSSAPATGAFPAFMLQGASSPHGVAVSPVGGEIWVADTGNQRVVRYPTYFNLLLGGSPAIEAGVPAYYPLGMAIDGFGNVVVAENVNRVSLYFPGLNAANAASYSPRPLSPGQIASVFPRGTGFNFGTVTLNFDQLPNPVPLPTVLADLSVTLGDKPIPLYFISPGQINFMVPMSNPESGTAEMQVIRPSTQQIIAATTMTFGPAMPALFTSTATGSGQIAALNEDNTINSATNPIQRGKVIQMFGTGQGFVANAPPDGTPTPAALLRTTGDPLVIMGGQQVPTSNVLFSGLAPGLIGVWQINVRIPDYVNPLAPVQVAVLMRSIPSTSGPDPSKPLVTTIAVKQ